MKIKIPELKDFNKFKKALPYITSYLHMVKPLLVKILNFIISIWVWIKNIDADVMTAFFVVNAMVLMLWTLFYFTVIDHECKEIEPYEYERIEKITHEYPDIKLLVTEALEDDGVISNWEYDTIHDAYRDREEAIEERNKRKERDHHIKKLQGGK